MKCLFLKSNTHWGGPWLSFKYNEITIDKILKNSYGKAGHPIPMICLFKMDVIIVNNNDLVNCDKINYNNNNTLNHKKENLEKYMHNIYRLKDVPFNNYDIIYTEDEIIPKYIINKYKEKLFVFNASEHHLYKKYYDVLIDHKNKWAFPHCMETFKKYTNDERKYIYLEFRTASNDNCINKFKNDLKLGLVYNDNMRKGINPWSSKIPEKAISFWEDMGKCKYYVQLGKYLQGLRIGQGFVNAACLNIINIGICQKNSNHEFIYPLCVCKEENDAIRVIKMIEEDKNLYNKIIIYQNYKLEKLNMNFHNLLKLNLDKKIKKTRNIEKKHIQITWKDEKYKSAGDEDIFIINYFNRKRMGFLLDIACACPVSGSLTFKLLNNYFWEGILVEPSYYHKKNIEACYDDVDNIHFFNGAIHSKNKTVKLYEPINKKMIGLTSTNIKNIKNRTDGKVKEYEVDCMNINELLEKYNAPEKIDFLNLDIEGSEDEVILDLNYDKYDIKLICIENGEKYKNFLKNKGYKISDTTGYKIVHGNIFFEKI